MVKIKNIPFLLVGWLAGWLAGWCVVVGVVGVVVDGGGDGGGGREKSRGGVHNTKGPINWFSNAKSRVTQCRGKQQFLVD
jgi:hypothetical protein